MSHQKNQYYHSALVIDDEPPLTSSQIVEQNEVIKISSFNSSI